MEHSGYKEGIMRLIVLSSVLLCVAAGAWAGADNPAAARTPVVDERLVGTWRPIDPETNEFVPIDSSDVVITGDSFTMGGGLRLPQSEDCAVLVAEGKIGQTCELGQLILFHYAFDPKADRLYIHGEPDPTPATEGVAVYQRR